MSEPLEAGNFCEIPVDSLIESVDVGMKPLPELDLFLREADGKMTLLKSAKQPFSPLALSIHKSVWLREDDVNKVLSHPAISKSIPQERKAEILRRSAIKVVDDLFVTPTPDNMKRSQKVVGNFVYFIMKDPKAYLLLNSLSSHDPYTLQHSVGTSVTCIILAKKMGITSEAELAEVGLAGLLHDIGKVQVKTEIINKPGPLDEVEWEEMRQHSTFGYEIVKDQPFISDRTKKAILEHHEDKLGTGYPEGKKSEECDLFSRIVGICDIFNALTTDRTYAKAKTPFEAFQLMREKMSHKIDDKLFKELVMIYGGKL